ncbi:MAG: ion transporter [Sphingomonadales bacterium]|nr:ion transporter [Sphingomonadales bacterium]
MTGYKHSIRRRFYDVLEMGVFGDRVGMIFDRFMIALILLNAFAVAAETVSELYLQYKTLFDTFEIFSLSVFVFEYVTRIWVSVEVIPENETPRWKQRLKYMLTPFAIIDLLAIMPFHLFSAAAFDLRFLRLFRLLRLLKLMRYSPALISLGRVIYEERRALIAALIIMMGMLFFAASMAYFIEHDAQPDVFANIPQALWWAVATLTTVGYGDVVPITVFGKILGGTMMIFGLAFYAIPIGIVASAFSSEIHRRDFVVRESLVARVPLFEGLQAETVQDIGRLLRSLVVEKGGVISHRGQVADGLYFLVSGEALAYTSDGVIPIRPGGFFGEVSLLKTTFREATIVARTTCRLMVLETHDFQHLLVMQPALRSKLEQLVQNHLDEFVELGELSSSDRDEIMKSQREKFGSI